MNDASNAPGRRPEPGFWRTNRGIGAQLTLLMLVLLTYLLATDWAHVELRDGFLLGAVPVAATVAMLVCTVTLMVDAYRHEAPERLLGLRWRDAVNVALLVMLAWLLFELGRLTNTLIAAPLYLFTLFHLLGVRPWTASAVAAAIMGGTVYGAFSLLGIELPHDPALF